MGVILETERLVLRSWELSDLHAAFALWSHPEVMKFVGTNLPQQNLQQTRSWLEWTIAYEKKNGFCRWAVDEKATDKLIGSCGFVYQDQEREVDLGYYILPEHWGRGYATEIASACIKFGIDGLGLQDIAATADTRHLASKRVLEKLGFEFVKIVPNGDGTFDDVFVLSKKV